MSAERPQRHAEKSEYGAEQQKRPIHLAILPGCDSSSPLSRVAYYHSPIHDERRARQDRRDSE
jgi:hypothetical protein